MAASNFNLRGISAEVMTLLKKEAKRLHISVNILILKLIESRLGLRSEIPRPTYHELDSLAGSWSGSEAKIFEKNTKDFEEIDKELWL